jgi:hypothetical protein
VDFDVTDQIFCIRQILGKKWEYNETVHQLITTKLLDFVHRPDFHKPENTTFWKLDLFPSSGWGGGGPYST